VKLNLSGSPFSMLSVTSVETLFYSLYSIVRRKFLRSSISASLSIPFGGDSSMKRRILGFGDDHLHGVDGTVSCNLGQNLGLAKRGSHIANRPWKNVKRQGLPPLSR